MYRMQCALVLAALSVGLVLVHSWDIAITTGNRLEFYSNNGSKIHSIESVQFRNLRALTYDAVYNTLFFVDKQSDNASIFRYNISTKNFESLVTTKNIGDIAFDPAKELLFWTEDKSIYWISIKSGLKKNLITMDNDIPFSLAVDSCRGYIYWVNENQATIERVHYNGSERQLVIDEIIWGGPVSLAIDQQKKKMFWAYYYNSDNAHYIKQADLNGNNTDILVTFDENNILPNAITISKDSIYWIEQDSRMASVRQYKVSDGTMKTIFRRNKTEIPYGIVANYKIEEETQGIHECEALTNLLPHNSVTNDSLKFPADFGLSYVHGTKVNGESLCNCTPGYTSERCNVSVCQNYCLQGNCSVSAEGQPECSCGTGYSGQRCEVNVCFNYCLNNGVCFLHEELYEPVCQCTENYEGSRCEAVKDVTISITPTYNPVEKNLTVVDLVSNRRKTTAKFSVIVEVESP